MPKPIPPEQEPLIRRFVRAIFEAGWPGPSGGRNRTSRYDAVHAYAQRVEFFNAAEVAKGTDLRATPLSIRQLRSYWQFEKTSPDEERARIDRQGNIDRIRARRENAIDGIRLTKEIEVDIASRRYDKTRLSEASLRYLERYYPEVYARIGEEGFEE